MNLDNCPVCNSNNIKTHLNEFYGYKLIKCDDCQVVFSDPFKAPSMDFYAEASDIASADRHTKLNPWHSVHPTRQSEYLKNGDGKELLDMGCGNGSFIEFASQNGFNVTGIDLDYNSLKVAERRSFKGKMNVYRAHLVEFHKNNPEAKFDVITAFEVVEHLDNTKEVLELIHSMLKPGGLFIGSLPNMERKYFVTVNMVYERPPYHLTYWTTKTWKFAVEKNFNFKCLLAENTVFYGYLSYIAKHKTLEKYNWNTNKGLGSFFVRSLFTVTGKIETAIQKMISDSASFYFVLRKN